MALEIFPAKQTNWKLLPDEGCINVRYKPLLKQEHLALVMLYFDKKATIHEHSADFDVNVVCLEGSGFTSVGKEQAPLFAGDRVRWPSGKPHRLWTTDSEMITLMVEHIGPTIEKNNTPEWEDVDSSMIAAFKYYPDTQTLDVMFHRTGVYSYFEVPADVVEKLRQADSKGRFMRYAIIDRYSYDKGG